MSSSTPERRSLAASAGEVLALIRATGGLSRAQLLERSGMARSTLYARLEELAGLGVVYEAEALDPAGRGRPSRRLRFDDRRLVVLAVVIGQAVARVAVTDTTGRELRLRTLPAGLGRPAEAVLEPLLDAGQALLDEGPGEVLAGVGIAVPAPVDVRTGLLHGATTVPDWPPDAALTAAGRFGVPVVVENDGRAEALGESRPGETLVYAKVATGISCGVVVDRQVLGGAHGVAGDIGHILVDPDGPVCRCGRRGCLAAFSSGAGMVGRLAGLRTLDDLVAALSAGDAAAIAELDAAAGHLGRALAAIVATLNPERLLLGGAVGRLRPMVERVRGRVLADVVDRVREDLRVEASEQGEAAGSCGLAALVMRRRYAPAAIDAELQR